LGLIKTVSHPVYGPVRLTRGPVDFEGGDKTKISNDGPFKAPPLLGEHTREVLTEELGLTGSELDRLKVLCIFAVFL
jgi:crotonobetainyl-CoA:carnitine CoA-transferase CaiB-like acyl-CoA transferase